MAEVGTSQEVLTIPADRIVSPVDGSVIPPPPPAPRDFEIKTIGAAQNRFRAFGVISIIGGLVNIGSGIRASTGGAFDLALFRGGFGVLVILLGVIVSIAATRDAKRRSRLYRDGELATGVVLRVDIVMFVRLGWRFIRKVKWAYGVDGVEHRGSYRTMHRWGQKYQKGDYIWVLYDPENPSDSVEWPPLT